MGGNFSGPFFSANEKSNHNPSRYVILIICSCSNANTCMPAEEIILNDGPDLFNDPLPGSLKNCQDQEIVINLITNVADYRCRFGKWLGCSMIGSKNTGSVNGSGFFVCLCLFLFFWLLHVGSFMSPTRDWTHASCSRSGRPNHCTARKVPAPYFWKEGIF